jgi:sugar/nucleoside kinase (ribokinase family)
MLRDITITCLGDIMLELIESGAGQQPIQRTFIVDHASAAVGGAVVNLCWNFGELGRRPTMVAAYGASEASRVQQALAPLHISIDSLVEYSDSTDLLVVLSGPTMPAAYVRGRIGEGGLSALAEKIPDNGLIVFGGSRHESFRKVILRTISRFRNSKFVFSPSYTVYDYDTDELHAFLRAADIVAVNEHEADYLIRKFSISDFCSLMQLPKEGGIVTLGPRGADIFTHGKVCRAPSVSGLTEDVVGAGEAFLAGFLHEYLQSSDWTRSGRLGCAVAAQVVRARKVRTSIDARLLSYD